MSAAASGPQDQFQLLAQDLPPDVQKQAGRLFRQARKAVHAYDGTSTTEAPAIAALGSIEHLRNQHFPAINHAERMQAEASLSGLSCKRPYSTDALLDIMIKKASRLLRTLRREDADLPQLHTVELDAVLVKPGKQFSLETGSGSGYEAASSVQRLERLMGILLRNGVQLDQMILYKGKKPEGTLRQEPYQVVAIPHLDAEIAVCNEAGQTTLLAHPALGRYAYTTLDKDQLKLQPGVRCLDHRGESWERGITDFINGLPAGRKVDVKAFAAKPPPYQKDVVNQWVMNHIRETGLVPTPNTGQLIGAEAGETGSKLDTAIYYKLRGTKGLNAKNLLDIIRQHRTLVS